MTELDYAWRLQEIMDHRGISRATALQPLLVERGITLSRGKVDRLVTEKPQRIDGQLLMALLDILECRIDELIEPLNKRPRQRLQSQQGIAARIGSHRPKRARVL